MNITAKDKIVVITGASKGIGAAVAAVFYQSGATVILLDISSDRGQLAGKARERSCFFSCDVSNSLQVKNAFREIGERFGRVDILVNNAGVQSYGKVTDIEEDSWDRTMNVNLKGIFLCSKQAIPLMKRSNSAVIVNMSSVQALVCESGVAAYAASKAGVLGLTNAIAVDYAPHIRCVAVCPGAVNTDLTKKEIMESAEPGRALDATRNIHLLKRISEPEEVAAFVLFLTSKQAAFCTGQYYRIDGGIGAKISMV